jgi:integrase/recombinase XerD
MVTMMNSSFGMYLTEYFGIYLPRQKGFSENTIKSYRDTFVQLIEYITYAFSTSCNKLTLEDFSAKRITCFLDHLEADRHISASSRNQRLAAIHSFFKYIQKHDLSHFEMCSNILSVEFKKVPVPFVSYLSIEEIRVLFSLPDTHDKHEFRDLALMTLLYETGARVQELIDLQFEDVNLRSCPTVTLHGKGNKSRVVPIGHDVVQILKKYLSDNQISDPETPVFTNKQHKKLTRVGVQYIVDKYVARGHAAEGSMFHGKITNHSFRHSKSMHLVEAGVNLIYIRDFLGHTSVTTTEIYGKANAELKRKAIEKHGAELKAKPAYSPKEKDDLLNWLKSNI